MSDYPMTVNTYDTVADAYAAYLHTMEQESFSFYHHLVVPQLLEKVGDVQGLAVLDAGCGEGYIARQVAARGATVTGIDVSPRLVEIARAQDPDGAIAYHTHDLSHPLPEYAGAFDVVVSNLVLNDVPDYEGFIATIGAVTKAGGRYVLSLNNPYSAVLREKVKNYFDVGGATLYNMAQEGVAVYYFHRTMEQYITAFRNHGFLVRGLYDVRVTDEVAQNLPDRFRKLSYSDRYHHFPFFTILDMVKVVVGG